MNSHLNKLFIFTFALSSFSQARIYLDNEEDPLPLVQLSVVLPAGVYSGENKDTGLALMLPDILEAGTKTKDKQSFLDELTGFGANSDFHVSEDFSTWSLSFPFVEGKNYDELAALLEDNWKNPRWTSETFDLAKKKLLAGLQGTLDSDNSLATLPSRRWSLTNFLSLSANTVEKVQSFTLDHSKAVFEKNFVAVNDIWVGYIGPASLQDLVKKIVTRVFSLQGKVQVGKHLEPLKKAKTNSAGIKDERHVFLMDKKDRNQTVTRVFALSPERIEGDDELAFFFGKHLLSEGGLGSIFWDEIRAKRGLSYFVGGDATYYFFNPVLGFITNPVRNRTDEALSVIATLINKSYVTGEVFKEITEENWGRQWQSFKFSQLIDQSTAAGRLSDRVSVVTGLLSRELFETPVDKWKVSQKDVQSLFPKLWKKSFKSISLVGDAKELKPLVEKNFPDYTLHILPYQKAVSDKLWDR